MDNARKWEFEIDDSMVRLILPDGGKEGMSYGEMRSIEQCKKLLIYAQITRIRSKELRAEWELMSDAELVASSYFAYSRHKNHGVNIYCKSPFSPTGIELARGISHEVADKILSGTSSPLSPTEDLRTA